MSLLKLKYLLNGKLNQLNQMLADPWSELKGYFLDLIPGMWSMHNSICRNVLDWETLQIEKNTLSICQDHLGNLFSVLQVGRCHLFLFHSLWMLLCGALSSKTICSLLETTRVGLFIKDSTEDSLVKR